MFEQLTFTNEKEEQEKQEFKKYLFPHYLL